MGRGEGRAGQKHVCRGVKDSQPRRGEAGGGGHSPHTEPLLQKPRREEAEPAERLRSCHAAEWREGRDAGWGGKGQTRRPLFTMCLYLNPKKRKTTELCMLQQKVHWIPDETSQPKSRVPVQTQVSGIQPWAWPSSPSGRQQQIRAPISEHPLRGMN